MKKKQNQLVHLCVCPREKEKRLYRMTCNRYARVSIAIESGDIDCE